MPNLRRFATALSVAIVVTAFATPALADTETTFLGPDGIPVGNMIQTPEGGEMPNYDLGRDLEPGLLLARSSLGLDEVDEARFQQWQMPVAQISGHPLLVLWTAAAGFQTGVSGVFDVYLLDCPDQGEGCVLLAEQRQRIVTGSDWTENEIIFPALDHEFESGRNLAVKVVVASESESDLMLAYGYPQYRSRLTISDEAPVITVEPATVSVAGLPPVARFVPEIPTVNPLETQITDSASVTTGDAWLGTLVVSTVVLTLLGAGLVLTMTPLHGRHHRPRHRALAPLTEPGPTTLRSRAGFDAS